MNKHNRLGERKKKCYKYIAPRYKRPIRPGEKVLNRRMATKEELDEYFLG